MLLRTLSANLQGNMLSGKKSQKQAMVLETFNLKKENK